MKPILQLVPTPKGEADGPPRPHQAGDLVGGLHPVLLTADEAATILRTTRKGLYSHVARGHLGEAVVRLGRRVLINREALLELLQGKGAPSPMGARR